jgi:hypothetical protein
MTGRNGTNFIVPTNIQPGQIARFKLNTAGNITEYHFASGFDFASGISSPVSVSSGYRIVNITNFDTSVSNVTQITTH